MKTQAKQRLPKILTAFILLCAVIYLATGFLNVGDACDGYYRWQESAYILRGVDPFAVAVEPGLVEPDIGPVNSDAGNMPWTFLLSNCIYPGFLQFSDAFIVARIVFALLLCLAVYRAWRFTGAAYATTPLRRLLLVGILFCCYMWFATLRLGNHGAYVTLCLFLLATFDHDRHWLGAGVLYAFIAMKPQLSGLFLLYYLIRGRFKPLLVAAGILAASTIAASVLSGTHIVEMLLNPFRLSLSYQELDNYIYYGLLDPLVSACSISSKYVMVPSMLMWIGFVSFVALRFKALREETMLALGSVSWMYVQPSDQTLLGLFGFNCCALLLFHRDMFPSRLSKSILAIGALINTLPLKGTVFMSSWMVPLAYRMILLAIIIFIIKREAGRLRLDSRASDPLPLNGGGVYD